MLSIVVPVFNEENNLSVFNKRLISVCRKIKKKFEVIYIDDGSKDRSLDLIKKFSKENKNVHYISLFRNFGQHAAVMAGLKLSKGKFIITLDSDLQNPPEEIVKFVKYLDKDFDVVAGKRIKRKDNLLRKILSYFMNIIISKLTGVKLTDYGCMMRMYKREIIDIIINNQEKYIYIPAFSSWLTNKTLEIPINHDSRYSGKTKYSFLKLLQQAFDLITSYTLVPIQVILVVGTIMFVLGIFLFFYLMSYRFIFGTPSSLTSFIAFQLLFSGMILLCLGIISEYLARIHKQTRKVPLYIIREKNIKDK